MYFQRKLNYIDVDDSVLFQILCITRILMYFQHRYIAQPHTETSVKGREGLKLMWTSLKGREGLKLMWTSVKGRDGLKLMWTSLKVTV